MTGHELVNQALSHKSGRVPYSIDLTSEACEVYGNRLLAEYRNELVMEDLGAGKLSKLEAVSLAIGNHILCVPPPWWDWKDVDNSFNGEDPPNKLPDTIGTGSYSDFFSQVAYFKERFGVYIITVIWGGHWEKAYALRGIENFLVDLTLNTQWAQELLNMIIRKNMVMLENILTAPEIDAVLLGSDWGTQKDLIMSPKCFRRMIKPGEKQEYDLIKRYGKKVFIHSCGNILKIIDDLIELEVDCLNPVQPECMDLVLLNKIYGTKLSFYGGISTQDTLPYGKPEDVRAVTRKVIELMGKNGGYITAPSQFIQTDVSYENLKILIDTAKEYA